MIIQISKHIFLDGSPESYFEIKEGCPEAYVLLGTVVNNQDGYVNFGDYDYSTDQIVSNAIKVAKSLFALQQ